jgi:predicted O-linked N-acetylglucosamine transferase (SPINDLY family)
MASEYLSQALAQAQARAMTAMQLLSAAGQLTAMGDMTEVAELYRVWLAHNADNPVAYAMYFNYAAVLGQLDDQNGAKAALTEAIRINPSFIPPYINLGHVLERLGAVGDGVQQWYKVAEMLPQVNGEGVSYKITALKQIGRVLEQYQIDENAEDALRLCLDINQHQNDVIQHWVSLRQRQCKWPVIVPWGSITREQLLRGISALSLAAHTDDPLMQLANAAAYNKAQIGRPERTFEDRHARLRAAAHPRRRKIGYLSSDLREHAIGFLTAELYEVHDRSRVEIFLYYCGHKVKDGTHQRIKAAADHWIDISGLSDEQAAERMVADGIEILVDINGYTHSARLKVLALRPAPVIVNWLGFPGTLGSPSHHYLIADEFIIPRESEIYYAEKVLRLPCYQPNDRKRVIAERRPTRAEVGLPDDAMVYCCFNGAHKITPFTWRRWMAILKAVPNSVLWLLGTIPSTDARLKQHAAAEGVDPGRIIFAHKAKNPDHLARYPLADLFLDTCPYGAHTTSSDALWMGVPVITLAGRSFASRVCGSLLKSAGLPDLICSTPERYVELAVELGRDKAKLAALRTRLAASRDTCVLFDTPLLARSLEDLYDRMWADYTAGKLPRPDLTNLDIYGEIGIELDRNDVELQTVADYRALYLHKLAEKHRFAAIPPDRRLWSGEAPAAAPAPPLPAPTSGADALLAQANAALAKGDLAGGEAGLDRALELDPHNPVILDLAARVALLQANLEKAEALARTAVQIRPLVPMGLTLAEVIKAKGNLAGATKFFQSVLETNPRESRALVGLAEIYEQTGHRARAITYFEAALDADPGNATLAARYANLLPIEQLARGLAALARARPAADAPAKLRLAFLNQFTPYKEWAERAARKLMPYHATSLDELGFAFARAERDAYENAAAEVLTQDPDNKDALGAKAVCLLSRGQRAEAHAAFARLAALMPGTIYDAVSFDPALFRALEARADADLAKGLPPLLEVLPGRFAAGRPIIYLACNYAYFTDFARPMLRSIDDVADGSQVHLHIMDANDAELAAVKAFVASLARTAVAVSAERPGVAAKGLMPARCYYHAVRLIRLYQHLLQYRVPLWLMDVDALLHRDPTPLFARLGEADAALRARPGRWEPWNQFNASVFAVAPGERGARYLKLIAAYIADFHARDRLRWGIDQQAMFAAHAYLADTGRAPRLQLLDDRAVDYEYYEDGFVWCNSGKGKFSQLQQIAADLAESPDSQKVSYFAALKKYMSGLT